MSANPDTVINQCISCMQYGLKYLRPPLVVVYRDGCHWWASVELSRRFFLILFTVALPRNEVGSNWGLTEILESWAS